VPERVTLREHLKALRAADAELAAERDRRYAEVSAEQGKALRIKETADEKALDLASQIQTYKDQQHNGLLQQLTEERGRYATQGDLKSATEKLELAIKPLGEYVAAQQGRTGGAAETRTERRLDTGQVLQLLILVVAVTAIIISVISLHK
jgi:hypothetical protein